jgi:hypothetical protein
MKMIILATAAVATFALIVPTESASARYYHHYYHHYRGWHGAYGYYHGRDPDWFIREDMRRDVPLKDRPPS